MPTPLDMQRTYAIVGTGGCGKTSIAEMLLFNAGAINRMGAIEEGTTCLDYEPEEIKRFYPARHGHLFLEQGPSVSCGHSRRRQLYGGSRVSAQGC